MYDNQPDRWSRMMIYRLIVNAAFLAAGYYIGKQVGQNELVRKGAGRPREYPPGFSGDDKTGQHNRKPGT